MRLWYTKLFSTCYFNDIRQRSITWRSFCLPWKFVHSYWEPESKEEKKVRNALQLLEDSNEWVSIETCKLEASVSTNCSREGKTPIVQTGKIKMSKNTFDNSYNFSHISNISKLFHYILVCKGIFCILLTLSLRCIWIE